MRRLLAPLILVLSLVGCATVPGPTSITLSAGDIERDIAADLGSLVELFRGLDVRRPEVGLMPVAGRLEVVWNLAVPGQAGDPGSLFGTNYGVAVVLSGRPQLNRGRDGIDLADVRLDDVRMLGVPRVLGFGIARLLDRKGAAMPDMPLVGLPPRSLRVGDVAYEATGVEVTWRGVRVDLVPR